VLVLLLLEESPREGEHFLLLEHVCVDCGSYRIAATALRGIRPSVAAARAPPVARADCTTHNLTFYVAVLRSVRSAAAAFSREQVGAPEPVGATTTPTRQSRAAPTTCFRAAPLGSSVDEASNRRRVSQCCDTLPQQHKGHLSRAGSRGRRGSSGLTRKLQMPTTRKAPLSARQSTYVLQSADAAKSAQYWPKMIFKKLFAQLKCMLLYGQCPNPKMRCSAKFVHFRPPA
jgi:hypothetical protein